MPLGGWTTSVRCVVHFKVGRYAATPWPATLPSHTKFEINSLARPLVGSWLAVVSPLPGKKAGTFSGI
jgi:hypothetical protein